MNLTIVERLNNYFLEIKKIEKQIANNEKIIANLEKDSNNNNNEIQSLNNQRVSDLENKIEENNTKIKGNNQSIAIKKSNINTNIGKIDALSKANIGLNNEKTDFLNKYDMLKLLALIEIKEDIKKDLDTVSRNGDYYTEIKDVKLPKAVQKLGYNSVASYVNHEIERLKRIKATNNLYEIYEEEEKYFIAQKQARKISNKKNLTTILKNHPKNKKYTGSIKKRILAFGLAGLVGLGGIYHVINAINDAGEKEDNPIPETTDTTGLTPTEPTFIIPYGQNKIECSEEGLKRTDGTVIAKNKVDEINMLAAQGKWDKIDLEELRTIGLREFAYKVKKNLIENKKINNSYNKDFTVRIIQDGNTYSIQIMTLTGDSSKNQAATIFNTTENDDTTNYLNTILTSMSQKELYDYITSSSLPKLNISDSVTVYIANGGAISVNQKNTEDIIK